MNVFTRVLSGASATLVSAALLAGCGGGASGSTLPVQNGSGTSPMTLTLTLPGRSTTAKSGKRVPLYTSIDTKGIGVEYKAHGAAYTGAPSAQPAFGAAIGAGANGNATCTAAGSDGSYSCTLSIPAVPVGYDDFRVTLWNAAPAGCTSSGSTCNFLNTGDKALSYAAVSNQAIVAGVSNKAGIDGAGSSNTLGFTLNPVVDNVALTLSGAIVNGQASDSTVTVSAKDAAGNVILTGDQFVDANGNALTIALSIANNCGTALAFTAPSSSPSFSNGAADTATVHYDGSSNCPTGGASVPQVQASASQALSGSTQDAAFSVTASSGSVTITGVPQVTAAQALAGQPVGLTAASDRNFYVAEAAPPYMEQVNPLGGAPAAVGVVSNSITAVAMGQDGDLWYTDNQHSAVVKQALGTATSGSAQSMLGISSGLANLAAGPDGNMWIVDAATSNFDSLTPSNMTTLQSFDNTGSGGFATTPIAAGTFPNGDIVACGGSWGPNGSNSYMMCRNQTRGLPGPISLGAGTIHANGMAFGPDHELYVTTTTGKIETFTSGFAAGTMYTIPNGGVGGSIVAGPDGNMWFTIGTSGLGRIVLSGSATQTITGWPDDTQIFHTIGMPANTPDFIQLAVGSDNRLWALDAANNQVVRIDP